MHRIQGVSPLRFAAGALCKEQGVPRSPPREAPLKGTVGGPEGGERNAEIRREKS